MFYVLIYKAHNNKDRIYFGFKSLNSLICEKNIYDLQKNQPSFTFVALNGTKNTLPDLTPSQFQYWTSLNPSLISLLIQSYDHVTFYTCQYKCKSGLRLGKSNPSLI